METFQTCCLTKFSEDINSCQRDGYYGPKRKRPCVGKFVGALPIQKMLQQAKLRCYTGKSK